MYVFKKEELCMTYEKAMAEVVEFENTDVITTSGCGPHVGYVICVNRPGSSGGFSMEE